MNDAPPELPEATPPTATHKAARPRIWGILAIIVAALGLAALFIFPRARDSKAKANPPPAAPDADESWLSAKDFSASNSVSVVLGEQESGNGLELLARERDGLSVVETVSGVRCRRLSSEMRTSTGERRNDGYLYFFINPTFKKQDTNSVRIEVEYYNEKKAVFALQYDACASPKSLQSKYTRAGHTLSLDGAKEWETAVFHIRDGAFEGSENGGADFRLVVIPPELCVRRVTVTREREEEFAAGAVQ